MTEVMRLLHVIQLEPGPAGWLDGRAAWRWEDDAPAAACAGVIAASPAYRHEVCVLGSPTAVAWSPFAGMPGVRRLWSPMGSPMLATAGVRGRVRRASPDLVVAWGAGAAKIARVACVGVSPWAFVDFAAGTVAVLRGETPTVRPLEAAGPVRFANLVARAEARRMIGIAGDEQVVACLTRCPGAASTLAYVLGILNVAAIPAIGLIDPRAPGLARALRHTRPGAYARRIVVAPVPLPQLWDGCDAGLHVMPETGAAPFAAQVTIAAAVAGGLPVVAAAFGDGLPGLGHGHVVAASSSRADLARGVARAVAAWRGAGVPTGGDITAEILGALAGTGVAR